LWVSFCLSFLVFCVVFLLCLSSFCVLFPYVACLSGLSILDQLSACLFSLTFICGRLDWIFAQLHYKNLLVCIF
jgi:hypothetical protein